MQGLPDIPIWLLAVFGVLVKFIVDLVNGDYKKPMAWVSIGVAQLLCWWMSFDAFVAANLVAASPVGIALTGLMIAAGASSVVHPLSKAASNLANFTKTEEE